MGSVENLVDSKFTWTDSGELYAITMVTLVLTSQTTTWRWSFAVCSALPVEGLTPKHRMNNSENSVQARFWRTTFVARATRSIYQSAKLHGWALIMGVVIALILESCVIKHFIEETERKRVFGIFI